MPPYRHLVSTTQLDRSWIESELFPLCEEIRQGRSFDSELRGRAIYCLFYEPSFLTRTLSSGPSGSWEERPITQRTPPSSSQSRRPTTSIISYEY